MKKPFVILAIVAAVLLIVRQFANTERVPITVALPDSPSFTTSNQFDGNWEGKRVDVSGDRICLQTRIIGNIDNGQVTLKLMYNNTMLKGWISEQGKLELYSDSPRWGYRFNGIAMNNKIDGEWKVTNARCHGTWHIEKAS
ncbi:hypothetical protein [Photobacterium sanguinicancri]|uniref:hypothetical protein n=1 Tax=Photobacterium sanguinicancri TaxID=875932 RepID=UPI003D0E2414